MSEQNFMGEMAATELGTDVPTNEGTKDERQWFDAEGNEVSKSAFIRDQFLNFNKSRKQISEEYDIPYRTVYGATVNMVNDAEPSARGRGIVNSKVKLVNGNDVLLIDGDKYFINGEEVSPESVAGLEYTEVDRNTWIKEQVDNGVNRGDIAKFLGLSYGVIYGLTKDAEGTRQKHEIELADGTTISRSEYIRQRVAAGATKAEVAKELGVEYSVVWQATKQAKTTAEKLADAIAALEKFSDNVVEADAFGSLINALKGLTVKEETPAVE